MKSLINTTILLFSIFFISCVSNNLWNEINSPIQDYYPMITSIYPEDDSAGVESDQLPFVEFNKEMDGESVESGFKVYIIKTENIKEDAPGEVIYDEETKTATFYPDNKLSRNSNYEVNLSENIKDASGLSLQPGIFDLSYTFSTKDFPYLVEVFPTSEDSPVDIDTDIVITFSEKVKIDNDWEVKISGTGLTDETIVIDGDSDQNQKKWSDDNRILIISNIDFRYGNGESQRPVQVKLEKFIAEIDGIEIIPDEYIFTFQIQSSWRQIVNGLPQDDNISSTDSDRPIVLKKVNNTPLIAYKTSNIVRVFEFNKREEKWISMGDISGAGSGNVDLCRIDDTTYVAYRNISGRASVAKSHPDGWVLLKNTEKSTDLSTGEIADIQIVSDKGRFFIAYSQLEGDASGLNSRGLYVLHGNNDSLITDFLNEQPIDTRNHLSISLSVNKDILYAQYTWNSTYAFKTFDISANIWDENEKNGNFIGTYQKAFLTFYNHRPYVAYYGNFFSNTCYAFNYLNERDWIPFPTRDQGMIKSPNSNFDLIIDNNTPYFVFINESNRVQFTYPTKDDEYWKGVGGGEELQWKIISNEQGDCPSVIIDKGKLIVAYKKTSSSSLVVQQQVFK